MYKILSVLSNFIIYSMAEDVLGCGGFIKSHVPIDFSKIEVKLLTKQGILKDKTNCAPNNGYYFIPLYDKGEYILELQPPPGWSFHPANINIVIDGINDLCTQGKDLNFIFKGFGITGHVESLGSNVGPKDVKVVLRSDSEIRETKSSSDGHFFFTPVFPGTYTLTISHSKWKIFKSSVQITVTEGNTELPAKSLIIEGYDVKGRITSDEEPVEGAIVVLFPHINNKNKQIRVEGCNVGPLEHSDFKDKPICYVVSNEGGEYNFPVVQIGDYYLQPYYGGQNIYFQPKIIEFSVNHDSTYITNAFEIIGFSVTGRVLKSSNGIPVINATVFLNGKAASLTNSMGFYKLEKLKAGMYTLQVTADNMQFHEKQLKLSPNTPNLGDLFPRAFKICGRIISDTSQKIIATKDDSTSMRKIASDPGTGLFCDFIEPGTVVFRVELNATDELIGIRFYPLSHKVEVTSENMNVVTFSQLKATLIGTVNCLSIRDCEKVSVILRPSGSSSTENDQLSKVKENVYTFENVYPGTYDITIPDTQFCWEKNKFQVAVNEVKVNIPTVIQTGYTVTFFSTHSAQITYDIDNKTRRTVDIMKGRTNFCVENYGTYKFEIVGCHEFDNNEIIYNTESGSGELYLKAVKHINSLWISCDEVLKFDIYVSINIGGAKRQMGPLAFRNSNYLLELPLSPDETVIIVPQSDLLYFTPPIASVQGTDDCKDLGVKFIGKKGLIFKGKITPPLEGVQVKLETDTGETLTTETNSSGWYKFSPMDSSKDYKITAYKVSYVLTGPDDKGNFLAHKLAEVAVEVTDGANNSPLQGALLSLSGGSSYRSNMQTDDHGKVTFQSLSPGEYYLKPVMKEYVFVPSSKIISVIEGEVVKVKLIGKRVAYSAFGVVRSLSGEPEMQTVVIAKGIGNCSHLAEESTSEISGNFRIRGLIPFCSYEVKVLAGQNASPIERTVPKTILIENIFGDIHDVKLVIFRAISTVNILANVYTQNPEYYKMLQLKVAFKSTTANPCYTSPLDAFNAKITNDQNRGIMVNVPSIPQDNRAYVVYLETSLPVMYKWTTSETENFVANSSFKYVELKLFVRDNVTEQAIKQISVWTLIFIIVMLILGYNIKCIIDLIGDKVNVDINYFFNLRSKHSVQDYPVDNADIDQIVKNINSIKRKPKLKRI